MIKKRARNLTLNMSTLGLSSLETIKAVLDNELAHATTKEQKLILLFQSTNVKVYIDERTEKGAK